jgi:hypothetical protein
MTFLARQHWDATAEGNGDEAERWGCHHLSSMEAGRPMALIPLGKAPRNELRSLRDNPQKIHQLIHRSVNSFRRLKQLGMGSKSPQRGSVDNLKTQSVWKEHFDLA